MNLIIVNFIDVYTPANYSQTRAFIQFVSDSPEGLHSVCE